jgi:hypothetical protein
MTERNVDGEGNPEKLHRFRTYRALGIGELGGESRGRYLEAFREPNEHQTSSSLAMFNRDQSIFSNVDVWNGDRDSEC